MIDYENDCVDCGLPCFNACKYKNVPHYYCDECGAETKLFRFDGEELCLECIAGRLDEVN